MKAVTLSRMALCALAAWGSLASVAAGFTPLRQAAGAFKAPAVSKAEREARIAYLKKRAASIKSVDAENDDFADLEPLGAAIGNRRIVMLGETTHGDGPVFTAKIRLIKFLHERMGFDVLAFESGFYDMRRASSDMRSGRDPQEALASALFVDWSASLQMRPLWSYLADRLKAGHPLELPGFDMQFTGSASSDHLLKELDGFLARACLPPEAAASASRVKSVLGLVFKDPGFVAKGSEFQSLEPEDRAAALDAHRALGDALKSLPSSGESDALERDYWIQLLKSIAALLGQSWRIDPLAMSPEMREWAFNVRDRQMADNLLWLAERAYPKRKIIVWAATSHIIRRRDLVTNISDKIVPMGDWLDKTLGSEIYALGFCAYQGWWGTVEMALPAEVPAAEANSLEELFLSAGFEYAFADFRNLGSDGAWLRGPLLCRPMTYSPMIADWTCLLDGIFFIRETSPSVRTGYYRLKE